MTWIILVVLITVIALLVLAAIQKKQSGTIDLPYSPSKGLLSAAERSFLGVLDQAVGSQHRVFAKARVADLATVNSGLSQSARQGALNRIASKHFDFVVCRTGDLSVACAVELDDASHGSKRAKARDALVAGVCRRISLPIMQIPAKPAYVVSEIRDQFLAATAPTEPGSSSSA